MQAFDASSMMHAWDNYPIDQFPPLWVWIGNEIATQRLVMPTVAIEEVGHKLPECAEWVRAQGIGRIEITGHILAEAMRIKGMLGIVDDRYSPKGVDENDLLIIAATRLNGRELVSNEAKQLALPQNIANSKIPAVCGMDGVQLACIDFLAYMKRSRAVYV
ncbi:DUF4411 family protein [Burkholderia thailandensis]|uniref:DUF4411 family protein n=1 Tax=Burkholderia thailandensis TaxID=57975 RepID=UPI000369B22D|nr:DUF4411 family protein [Burkholderia thailandensis]MCS6429063.1 DUF4411 family protein [Burkholderia thailandensis]MCS6451562.1 DUF4411 family protein [Burkholderia thailandensis]MCS6463649.1 DUF4411 family protein [Burkholderia thailandensis]MCS6484168.1 DUF4411 family protein [Burkholderia thailandensis]MCS6486802.1 DUF4411 family protein [Burkholderia thailandensis]